MTIRTHDRKKLFYWKKIIREAEAYEGTNIDWMRKHGITDGSYYYWHRVLRIEGMLDAEDEPELKDIQIPCLLENQEGAAPGFVEYTPRPDKREVPLGTSQIQGVAWEPQLMLQKNRIQIYVGDSFHENTLSRVLEVVSHVK